MNTMKMVWVIVPTVTHKVALLRLIVFLLCTIESQLHQSRLQLVTHCWILMKVVRHVFATQSLGMGIDCPNIQEVTHWGVLCSLQYYLQESGRAGRDGLPAKATLLHAAHQLTEALCNRSVIDYCNSQNCYHNFGLFLYYS